MGAFSRFFDIDRDIRCPSGKLPYIMSCASKEKQLPENSTKL
jgi:hypothetical protein